jgi:hypothetical protein
MELSPEQIYQTNRALDNKLWKPLSDLSKLRNAEKVTEKQVHQGKIKGKRRCVKCGKYVDMNKVVRHGKLKHIYCIPCDKTRIAKPKQVNYVKP